MQREINKTIIIIDDNKNIFALIKYIRSCYKDIYTKDIQHRQK